MKSIQKLSLTKMFWVVAIILLATLNPIGIFTTEVVTTTTVANNEATILHEYRWFLITLWKSSETIGSTGVTAGIVSAEKYWPRLVIIGICLFLLVAWSLKKGNRQKIIDFFSRTFMRENIIGLIILPIVLYLGLGYGVGYGEDIYGWVVPRGIRMSIIFPMVYIGTLYGWLFLFTLRTDSKDVKTVANISGTVLDLLSMIEMRCWLLLPATATLYICDIFGTGWMKGVIPAVVILYLTIEFWRQGGLIIEGLMTIKRPEQEQANIGPQGATHILYREKPLPFNFFEGKARTFLFTRFARNKNGQIRIDNVARRDAIQLVLHFYDKFNIRLRGEFFIHPKLFDPYRLNLVGGEEFMTSLQRGSKENIIVSTLQSVLESVGSLMPADELFRTAQLGALLDTILELHTENSVAKIKKLEEYLVSEKKLKQAHVDDVRRFSTSNYFESTSDGKWYTVLNGIFGIARPIQVGDVFYDDPELQRKMELKSAEEKEQKGQIVEASTYSKVLKKMVDAAPENVDENLLAIMAGQITGKDPGKFDVKKNRIGLDGDSTTAQLIAELLKTIRSN